MAELDADQAFSELRRLGREVTTQLLAEGRQAYPLDPDQDKSMAEMGWKFWQQDSALDTSEEDRAFSATHTSSRVSWTSLWLTTIGALKTRRVSERIESFSERHGPGWQKQTSVVDQVEDLTLDTALQHDRGSRWHWKVRDEREGNNKISEGWFVLNEHAGDYEPCSSITQFLEDLSAGDESRNITTTYG